MQNVSKILLATFLAAGSLGTATQAQSRYADRQVSINGFRNPSIGLEYQQRQVSLHAGYYLTNFRSNETTRFVKAGATYWFLPLGKNPVPTSFYVGASYLRGLSREYRAKNAAAAELGMRFAIYKGLNLRLGIIALAAPGESLKINPTPGISYSIVL